MEPYWLIRKRDFCSGRITASELAWDFITFAADIPIAELVQSLDSEVITAVAELTETVETTNEIPRRQPEILLDDEEPFRIGISNWHEYFKQSKEPKQPQQSGAGDPPPAQC